MDARTLDMRNEGRLSGRKVPLMVFSAVPAAVVGLSAESDAGLVSGIFAGLWLVMLIASISRRWAVMGLPFLAGAFMVFTLGFVPFGSRMFVVDYSSAAFMLLLALLAPTATLVRQPSRA
jgi:hypothetical protein